MNIFEENLFWLTFIIFNLIERIFSFNMQKVFGIVFDKKNGKFSQKLGDFTIE